MEHGSCVPQGTEVVQTGFHYTLSLIGGKYKMAILYLLAEHGVLRHNAIHRRIAGIPYKTLAVVLKELASVWIVQRSGCLRSSVSHRLLMTDSSRFGCAAIINVFIKKTSISIVE